MLQNYILAPPAGMLVFLSTENPGSDSSEQVADPGGHAHPPTPPASPVKINHEKDTCRRRLHRFHVSRPPLPDRWIHYCELHTYNHCTITSVSNQTHNFRKIPLFRNFRFRIFIRVRPFCVS